MREKIKAAIDGWIDAHVPPTFAGYLKSLANALTDDILAAVNKASA